MVLHPDHHLQFLEISDDRMTRELVDSSGELLVPGGQCRLY